MNDQDLLLAQEMFIKELQRAAEEQRNRVEVPLEYRAYHDEEGKIITYASNRNNLPGTNFVVITLEQYNMARHDAIVKNGKLVMTNSAKQVYKIVKVDSDGTYRVAKQDLTVIANEDEEHDLCSLEEFEIE